MNYRVAALAFNIDSPSQLERIPEGIPWLEAQTYTVAEFETGTQIYGAGVPVPMGSNTNDSIFNALGDQGFTGHINDRLLAYYRANGATSKNINDAEREMLLAQGATPGHIDDMWFQILGDLGYTGSINDRLGGFFADGGTFGPPEPPTPTPPPVVWNPLPIGLNSTYLAFGINSIDTDGQGTWVAVGQQGGAARSTDNGLTWQALPQGINTGSQTGNLRVVKTNKAGVWIAAGSNGQASRSDDNGATWTQLPLNLGAGTFNLKWDIETDRNGVWICAGEAGFISRSIDNGLTWTELPRSLGTGLTSNAERHLATDRNGNWMYGAFTQTNFCARSTDNGATWTPFTISNTPNDATRGIDTDTRGKYITSGAAGNCWVSTDSTLNWSYLTPQGLATGAANTSLEALETDETGVWMAAGSSARASYSADNGVTWNTLPQGLNSGVTSGTISDLATDENGVWIAVLDNGYAARATPNAPEQITTFSVIPGVEQVQVAYSEPPSVHPVTSYKLQAKRTAASVWRNFSFINAGSLNETIYALTAESWDFRVAAVSVEGAGPWSATVSATPTAIAATLAGLFNEVGVDPNNPVTYNNNQGSQGADWNCNVVGGLGSAITPQIRKDKRCWQISGGDAGLISNAVTNIPQPYTVIGCMQNFFVQNNPSRIIIRADLADLSAADFTHNMWGGINLLNGAAPVLSTDMIFMLDYNSAASSLRVINSGGSDTTTVGNAGTNEWRMEGLGWSNDLQANRSCQGQFYEFRIYAGLLSTAEKNAVIGALRQKWWNGVEYLEP